MCIPIGRSEAGQAKPVPQFWVRFGNVTARWWTEFSHYSRACLDVEVFGAADSKRVGDGRTTNGI